VTGGSAAGDPRVVAALRGSAPGPSLIIVGGIHGNEPAGIAAALGALAALSIDDVRGEVIALIGNCRAVAAGRRHLGRDLNRLWTPEWLAAARATAGSDIAAGHAGAAAIPEHAAGRADVPVVVPELAELVELAAAIDAAIARARGPVYLVDLHTTSAPGFPFGVVGPTTAHRAFAAAFPLPGLVGLEQTLTGVLTAHYGARGCVTLAIEGGQHTTRDAADNLAAVLAIALEASSVVASVPGAAAARSHLAGGRGDLPPAIEVVRRHPVHAGDGFRMAPGFANLQRTAAGTLLAHDASGEIRAPFDGVLVLPLYQPDGDDGFFYGRPLG
jgi:predicted deacylase